METIIPHFDKYPLISQKQSDYIIFKNIIELMDKGEHLNQDGLTKIVNLKASLNSGIPENLKKYFPKVIKVKRSIINIPKNINPD
jgi:LAGLIDADG endonuclease